MCLLDGEFTSILAGENAGDAEKVRSFMEFVAIASPTRTDNQRVLALPRRRRWRELGRTWLGATDIPVVLRCRRSLDVRKMTAADEKLKVAAEAGAYADSVAKLVQAAKQP